MRQNDWLRKRIQYETEQFLRNGGKIEQVPPGKSSDFGNAAFFTFSKYQQKMDLVERNHNKPFWQVVSELASKGNTKTAIARFIELEPSEFAYLVKKHDKGHLWPIGKNC